MSRIYRLFGENQNNLDFSDNALKEMYDYESRGIGNLEPTIFSQKANGYYYGKKLLNLTVAMWKEDLGKTLFAEELYNDKFPHWWLNKVLGGEYGQ